MKRIFLSTLLIGFLQTSLPAQIREVSIPGSQVQTIHSSIVNQDYALYISLPAGYTNKKKTYPVLYLLDGQWDFTLATALYGEQYYDGFIPEMIIVGITWGGMKPNPDSLRARDYTPTNEKRTPQSGGAAGFLSFMKKELFPFIETHYKADKNDRILMGCSLGGLFTLYALFTVPELFQRYVAASPAFGWDNEVIYQYEKKYFETKSVSPARLYMTIGEVERGVPGFKKLTAHLDSRNYHSLQIKTRVLENTGHSGTKAEGFARGLQYVFERPSLSLTAAQLKKLSGKYSNNNGSGFEIKTEEGKPLLYFGGNNRFSLIASNENELYSTAEFLNLHVKRDDEGNVTGIEVERYAGSQFFSRVK